MSQARNGGLIWLVPLSDTMPSPLTFFHRLKRFDLELSLASKLIGKSQGLDLSMGEIVTNNDSFHSKTRTAFSAMNKEIVWENEPEKILHITRRNIATMDKAFMEKDLNDFAMKCIKVTL